MIIDTSEFKKLLKKAYKSTGFVIAAVEHEGWGYAIAGDGWYAWYRLSTMPKKVKAAIIELAGELPEPGEPIKVMDKTDNQYVLDDPGVFDVVNTARREKIVIKKTPICIEDVHTDYRLYRVGGMLTPFNKQNADAAEFLNLEKDEKIKHYYAADKDGNIFCESSHGFWLIMPAEYKADSEMAKLLDTMQ